MNNPFFGKQGPPEVLVHQLPPLPEVKRKILERPRQVRYNRLYDTLRTEQAWRYMADVSFYSTFTTSVGSVQIPITLSQPLNLRIKQWPGSTQAFLVLRTFSCAPQAASLTTLGAIDIQFQASGGYSVPLGDFGSFGNINVNYQTIIPQPLTDSGMTNLGTLIVALSTGASTATYYFQMGFSMAYLLPTMEPWEPEEKGENDESDMHDYHD